MIKSYSETADFWLMIDYFCEIFTEGMSKLIYIILRRKTILSDIDFEFQHSTLKKDTQIFQIIWRRFVGQFRHPFNSDHNFNFDFTILYLKKI